MQLSTTYKRKVYISGPMTGIPEFNFPAFEQKKKELEALGFEVLSPHEAPRQDSWEGYMKYDIKMLCDAELIYNLPGWSQSRGARIENSIADGLGYEKLGELA